VFDNPIAGATVQLSDGVAYNTTHDTSIYGQTYFDDSLSATTYQLDVSATGFDPVTQPISVSGNVDTIVRLVAAGGGAGGGSTTTSPSATSSTFLAGYDTRLPLSISGSTLFGSVTDFPVYVDLADAPTSFFSAVQPAGADIRVTEGDGLSEVPFELVQFNTASQSGQLYFKAPSLSIATTTKFYLYYGSSTASAYLDTDPYGAENVWTNNFLAVYHLEEDAPGIGNTNVYLDSTSNNAHGDDFVATTGSAGLFGSGQTFDNANTDYISLPASVLDGATNVTVSKWYRTTTNGPHPFISAANSSDANEFLDWFYLDGGSWRIELWNHDNNDFFNTSIPLADGNWRYLVWVRNDTSNQITTYVDGASGSRSASLTTLDVDSGGLIIGQDQDSVGGGFDSGQELDGDLDELWIAGVARSDSWIDNSYLNQSNPTAFYSIGAVEAE
jgi:hypothetical protein